MKKSIFALLLVSTLLAGCASIAATNADLVEETSRSLGLKPGSFTIYGRKDRGYKTSYFVKTKSGRVYNCYVTSIATLTGSTVSDAICVEVKDDGTESAPRTNALLEAADRGHYR